MQAVTWIFLDIGSTLIDECECYEARFHEMIAGTEISYEEITDKAIAFAKQGKKGDHECAKYYGLPLPKWHHELEQPYPDADMVLRTLKARGYRLGIIANQARGTEERLRGWDLREYFDLILSSAEEGLAKPDPALFARALERAGCTPAQAVMVGDRLDNDIVPAKALGMRTIWIRQGFSAYAHLQSEAEMPDVMIGRLDELCEVLP